MLRVLVIRAAMPPFSFALISRLSGSRSHGYDYRGSGFAQNETPLIG